jgi:hypothetical protein
MYSDEPLIFVTSYFEVEIAIEKMKYKFPGTD